MSQPPTEGPFRPGRSPDPGNLPGRRGVGGFFRRLFGRRPTPRPTEPPPRRPAPTFFPPPRPDIEPDEPPEDRPFFGGGGPPPEPPEDVAPEYRPPPFSNPSQEFFYQSNPGTHGLTPDEEEISRELYERGFIQRGPGSKAARDEWFDYTGMDPRNFDWESWRESMGS